MDLRLITFAIVLLAVYLAFGDFLTASTLSTPEGFVSDIGRAIGGAVTGVATKVGNLLGG